MKNPLLTHSEFSWRKFLTVLSAALFAFCVIGFEVANRFKEIPGAYSAIIAAVFLSYFGKTAIDNIKKPPVQ